MGPTGGFLFSVFHRFFREELLSFFRRHGVETVVKYGNKIYPASQNAREIVRVFVEYLEDNHVTVEYNTAVNHILVGNKRVIGVQTITDTYLCDTVILATGGASHPQTGSTGDGYRIARELGHTIIRLRPGLVPMVVEETDIAKSMMGSSLHNVRLTAFQQRADAIDTASGSVTRYRPGYQGPKPRLPVIESRIRDLMITHFGLSGPIALEMSLAIIDALENWPGQCQYRPETGNQ